MDETSDYDIIPHEEILRLRKEVNELKKHPLGSTAAGKDLVSSIKELNQNMTNLFNLFKEAAEEMKLEESEAKVIAEKMSPMMDKFDMLIDQNEKIATGIVAVADMVKEDAMRKPKPMPMRMVSSRDRPVQNRPSMPPPPNYRMPSMPAPGPVSQPPMELTPRSPPPPEGAPPMNLNPPPFPGMSHDIPMIGPPSGSMPILGGPPSGPMPPPPAAPKKKKGLFGF